jgi:hypothetical protein
MLQSLGSIGRSQSGLRISLQALRDFIARRKSEMPDEIG